QLQALATPPMCGDGNCTGDETADSCAADCTPCHLIDQSAAGQIVDDTSACFFAGGPQDYMRTENAGVGSSLRWTHATDADKPANFGRWSLHFDKAGRYQVEAFTPAPFNDSRQAVYQVHH